MKRLVSIAVTLCAVSGTLVAAQSKPAATADDVVMKADRALVAALDKGDRRALDKLLDPELMWIDQEGIMWFRDDALRRNMKSLVPSASDVKTIEHKYGKVVWIQNNQDNKYAAHFWVQRPAGWRLLHIVEIAQRPAEPGDARPNYFVACNNPCNEIPFKPLTDNEKAAVRGWQDMDSGDPALRALHLGSGTTITSTTRGGGAGPRAGGAGAGAAGRRAGGGGQRAGGAGGAEGQGAAGRAAQAGPPTARLVGAPPALFVKWWDFGDSAVSVMLHADYGARPYWASRVHSAHDGVWKMDESYHAVVWAAPRLTAPPEPGRGPASSN